MPGVVFTPLASVMVAKDVSVRIVVQLLLPSKVYNMAGGVTSDDTKLPASAPRSTGVKVLLVCPSKSFVTLVILVPAASTCVALVG